MGRQSVRTKVVNNFRMGEVKVICQSEEWEAEFCQDLEGDGRLSIVGIPETRRRRPVVRKIVCDDIPSGSRKAGRLSVRISESGRQMPSVRTSESRRKEAKAGGQENRLR